MAITGTTIFELDFKRYWGLHICITEYGLEAAIFEIMKVMMAVMVMVPSNAAAVVFLVLAGKQ